GDPPMGGRRGDPVSERRLSPGRQAAPPRCAGNPVAAVRSGLSWPRPSAVVNCRAPGSARGGFLSSVGGHAGEDAIGDLHRRADQIPYGFAGPVSPGFGAPGFGAPGFGAPGLGTSGTGRLKQSAPPKKPISS